MDRVMPTIEELQEKLSSRYTGNYGDDYDFYIVQYVQAQAMLHIVLELEQINNNLEALRGHDSHKGRIGWYDDSHVWHDGLMPLEGE